MEDGYICRTRWHDDVLTRIDNHISALSLSGSLNIVKEP